MIRTTWLVQTALEVPPSVPSELTGSALSHCPALPWCLRAAAWVHLAAHSPNFGKGEMKTDWASSEACEGRAVNVSGRLEKTRGSESQQVYYQHEKPETSPTRSMHIHLWQKCPRRKRPRERRSLGSWGRSMNSFALCRQTAGRIGGE